MFRFVLPIALLLFLAAGAGLPAQASETPAPAAKAPEGEVAKGLPPVQPTAPPMLMLKQYNQTHPERILMLFDRLAGIAPDFAQWAQKSPFLDETKLMDRDSIISREDNRLRRAWAELDTGEPIIVHTAANLATYSTLQEQLFIEDFNAKTFFAFKIYDENIAIVPRDIAKFSKIAISKAQMDEILKKSATSQVKVEILLKPMRADASTPFVHGDKNYWLLLADICEIRLWNNGIDQPQLLWLYRADWYKPRENESLLDLKGGL